MNSTQSLPATAKRPADAPDLPALLAAFKRSSPVHAGNWHRLSSNDDIRYNLSVSADGKKHGTAEVEAMPFENASDCRSPLADQLIRERVAMQTVAFRRAMIRPKAGQREGSNYAVKLLDHLVNVELFHDLVREVELSAQYLNAYGWTVLHPAWQREICLRDMPVTLEMAVQLSTRLVAEFPGIETLPLAILDPTQEDLAAQWLGEIYRLAVVDELKRSDIDVPRLSAAKLRRLVKELREDGKATLPVPYLSRNRPYIAALKPWHEVFISDECTDIQNGPVFRVWWLTEAQLRTMGMTENWEQDWIDKAAEQQGRFSAWGASLATQGVNPPPTLNSPRTGGVYGSTEPDASQSALIEVIFACYRQLDEDNLPGVYYTIFHPLITVDEKENPLYAAHGRLSDTDGRLPYESGQQENVSRAITCARGIPEIAQGWQRERKVQKDGIIDWTSMGTMPPLLYYDTTLGANYKMGPGARNPVKQGREPKFMEIPSRGVPISFETLEMVSREVNDYFGRIDEAVPPALTQMHNEMATLGFLSLWTRAFQQVLNLCRKFMPDAEFSVITGAPASWLEQRRGVPNALAAELYFDVRELDPEFVLSQLKTINETVLPGDVAGVVDRAKYTRLQLRAVNPVLAKELVADETAASQQIYERTGQELAMMFLGNAPQMVEMDPTAPAKLKAAAQIVGANPNYVQALNQGGRFREMLEMWSKNLMFSATQEKNKQVGRIGVNPEMMGAGNGRMGESAM